MTEFERTLIMSEFIGIVEDNKDPDKKQRVRIRIPYLHGDKNSIPTDALPWSQPFRDNDGLSFTIPEINKIVNVKFPTGNLYYPLYINAQHLNINLQKKVETLDGDDYTTFVSLCYNYNTQIFISNQEGIVMYHKFNGLNITEDGVTTVLKDSNSKYLMGNENADQELVLGTNFFKWFDSLISTLQSAPYLGNSGVNVIPTPDLIKVLAQYNAEKKDFLSKKIFAVDNKDNTKNKFDVDGQIGDKFTQTNVTNKVNISQSELNDVTTKDSNNVRIIEENAVDFGPKAPINTLGKTSIDQEDETDDIYSNALIENEKSPDYNDDVKNISDTILDSSTEDNSDDYGEIDWLSSSEDEDAKYKWVPKEEDDGDKGGTTITTSLELPISNDIILFNYDKLIFPLPNKSVNYNETYRLYIDYTKMPKPKLTKSMLVNWKLSAEGGLSRATTDSASKNKDNICPTPFIEGGKKLYGFHTNKGVTYSVWKKVFGKGNDQRFLNMSAADWEKVFDNKYWNKNASSKYESINCLFVSFAWGGNKVKTITGAEAILGKKINQTNEDEAVAALLSSRAQFFVNISQPSYTNNVYRHGWFNAINKLIIKIYG